MSRIFRGNSFLLHFTLKLALFLLALLLEFALNALFYNLNPTHEDNAPLFWDVIIQNFWVAFYSFAFSMLPLFVIGLTFTPPARMSRKLREAETTKEIIDIRKNEKES